MKKISSLIARLLTYATLLTVLVVILIAGSVVYMSNPDKSKYHYVGAVSGRDFTDASSINPDGHFATIPATLKIGIEEALDALPDECCRYPKQVTYIYADYKNYYILSTHLFASLNLRGDGLVNESYVINGTTGKILSFPKEKNKGDFMDKPNIATKDQINSMRVDYNEADTSEIKKIILFASFVLDKNASLDSDSAIQALGKGTYAVPKMPNGEVTYISYDNHIDLSFGLTGGPYGGIYKGYLYSFDREHTNAPWSRFNLNISFPYEYTVNIPITRVFLNDLGLDLVKTIPNFKCDNFQGRCHAFVYKSRHYPKLGFIFSTDLDRSDLKSGLPTNFRNVEIQVLNTPTS